MIRRIPNQNSDSVLKMSQKDEPKGNVRTHLAAVHENKRTCLVKKICISRTRSWIDFSPPVAHSGPAPLADHAGSAPVPEAHDASPPNPSQIFVEGTQLGSRGVGKPREVGSILPSHQDRCSTWTCMSPRSARYWIIRLSCLSKSVSSALSPACAPSSPTFLSCVVTIMTLVYPYTVTFVGSSAPIPSLDCRRCHVRR